ncbi:MAG: c-type cytochrome [Verrucomicrobiales bacterium]|nr:c-type cytochrome [Verrucomicrobiales bacterium]
MKRLILAAILCLPILFTNAFAGEPAWIWPTEQAKGKETAFFRKSFEVPEDAKQVILILAADNKADATLNGQRGGRLRNETWNRPFVENITDRVKKGEPNLLAIQVQNDGGPGALLAGIEVTGIDGKKTMLGSDATWQSTNRAEKGWNAPGFKPKASKWGDSKVLARLGGGPWAEFNAAALARSMDLRTPTATDPADIKLLPGFKAELLYSVPKAEQGSWVAMTIDDKNRMIVSDQYGALYRFKIPGKNKALTKDEVEKIELDIGGAHGLLYAFDALYAVLNVKEHGGRGLYRMTDTDGDDKFDKKELLRKFEEVGGEHGPHSVVLGPDGKSLYIVVGNQTPVTEFASSRVPQVWDEDLLLERPIGRGFMKGTPAPGGWIAKTDPDGREWELIATGFRNQFDAAFNREGELFTYDADMEWDMNTPWYRPTRINHVVSGAEFGWRNGGGKWPAYYPDSVGAVVDIGPGSPTGVTFGYGANFPQKYQDAFYAADWSYGKLFAVHLKPDGASYTATFEEFMSAQPLPLTDLLINPHDGAMYIAIGGRRVQSGLYRVTYEGDEPVGQEKKRRGMNAATSQRRVLEQLHGKKELNPGGITLAIQHLDSPHRALRYAARIALEHQPVSAWQEKIVSTDSAIAAINGLIALARHGDKSLQPKILGRLDAVEWGSLSSTQKTDLIRAYALAVTRMGAPDEATRQRIAARFMEHLPAKSPEVNIELLELLVYARAPVAEQGISLLKAAPSQEEQLAYAKSLRHLKEGWTRELRGEFFEWFARAAGYKGGPSFSLFVENMKKTALENTPEADKKALAEIINKKPETSPAYTFEPRPFVKNWTVADLDDVINVGLESNRDFENGRKMFGAGTCFACHRFKQQGGAIGPDLTAVAGKFSPRDLLESITDPNKEISDQYGSMIFTMNDGSVVSGRIMNLSGDSITVNTNMQDPSATTKVDRKLLRKMEDSKVSMMPPGLLNTMSKDDILDLLAYLLSGGEADDPMFGE